MLKRALLVSLVTLFAPSLAWAAPDMGIFASGIRFADDPLVAGQETRIYATLRNMGDADISGYVFFYQGSDPIGPSQIVSAVVDGENEQVWVDFTVPYGDFNIRAEIKGTDPLDQNATNDVAVTPLFSPIIDDDGDGIEDSEDNCPEVANTSQKDSDGDGTGDACDNDDDGDGLSDDVEEEIGTNPTDSDSDDDGVDDATDFDPLDAEVQTQPASTSEEGEEQGQQNAQTTDVNDDVEDSESEETQNGESEDETSSEEEGAENADVVVDEGASGSVLTLSPNATFVSMPQTWRTYTFRTVLPEDDYLNFSWDFGDGRTSANREVTHTFKSPGRKTVTLTVTNSDGSVETDSQEVEISFFHLSNPFVLGLVGVLFLLIVGFTALLFKRGRGRSSTGAAKTVKKPAPKEKKSSKGLETEDADVEQIQKAKLPAPVQETTTKPQRVDEKPTSEEHVAQPVSKPKPQTTAEPKTNAAPVKKGAPKKRVATTKKPASPPPKELPKKSSTTKKKPPSRKKSA